MKNHLKFFVLMLLLVNTALFAQESEPKKGKIDKKLVGTWYGKEVDNQRLGMEKHWIQERHKNGTYTIMFLALEDCVIIKSVEKGKWWVKDGIFYEYHSNSKKTDIYEYTMLDDDNVKFKAKSISIDFENTEYEFIDTRIKDE